MKNLILFFLIISTFPSFGNERAVLAVVDSWIDTSLPIFSGRIFVNSAEKLNGKDDDGNGLIDDISGWNFYHRNNQLFTYPAQMNFTDDLYMFYELRAKREVFGISDDEAKWIKDTYAKKEFKQETKIFRRYAHGTHVASIAAAGEVQGPNLIRDVTPVFKILPIKLYGGQLDWSNIEPTPSPEPNPGQYDHLTKKEKISRIKRKLKSEAYEMGERSQRAFKYLGKYAQVANCSYGSSESGLTKTIIKYYSHYFKGKISKGITKELLDYYAARITYSLTKAIKLAPKTLFIFSAGNSASNNDKHYHFPSDLELDNVLVVSSTYKDIKFGRKSNFGFHSVDLAAPGVAIKGYIPSQRIVRMTGTSQAAPYVSHLAALIVERYLQQGEHLNPSELKKILMNSVEKLPFLKRLIASEGLISPTLIGKKIK